MAFASQFEMIATLIKRDRFFMEIDEWEFGKLLTEILRLCHDIQGPKWDANDLGEAIASKILEFVGDHEMVLFPESEGAGFVDWDALELVEEAKVEATAERAAAVDQNPGLDIEGAQ